jgi:hypothetical protein
VLDSKRHVATRITQYEQGSELPYDRPHLQFKIAYTSMECKGRTPERFQKIPYDSPNVLTNASSFCLPLELLRTFPSSSQLLEYAGQNDSETHCWDRSKCMTD